MVKIYVDGSFINESVGFGWVALQNGQKVNERYGYVPHEKVCNTRQVAGEIYAVVTALQFCKQHNITEVEIYYDYNGIQFWATGDWKANLSLTQNYKSYVHDSGIKIHWKKVKAHTGDYWNEYVDQLAKLGAGMHSNQIAVTQKNEDKTQVSETTTDLTNPLMTEVQEVAQQFIIYLKDYQYNANFDNIYNGMYARILIPFDKSNIYFDLYNTQKKRLNPYIHNCKQANKKDVLLKLWSDFLTSKSS